MHRRLRRLTPIPALALVAAAAVTPAPTAAVAPAAPGAVAPAKQGSPPAAAQLSDCTHGSSSDTRLAVFKGSMRQVPGGRRMWLKFTLQERVGETRFRRLRAPGLGVWRKSRLGVGRFAHTQRVLALVPGSAYRVVVSFRWYDRHAKLVRAMKRRSPVCRQPGLLPNLELVGIGAKRVEGAPGTYRYALQVANRGRATASAFDVALVVDGAAVDSQAVASLAPGESRKVFITGPACTSSVEGRADAADAVRESRESDNVLTAACPAPG